MGGRAPVAAVNALLRRGLEIIYKMLRDALILSQRRQGDQPTRSETRLVRVPLTLARVPKLGPILFQALKAAGGVSRFILVASARGQQGQDTIPLS